MQEINSHFNHMCNLNLNLDAMPMKLTKIICTIGPTSRDVPILVQLIESGMNIARLNLSHGTHDYHRETIKNIREAAKIYEEKWNINPHIAVALDTRGREIRTGLFKGDTSDVELKKQQTLILTTDPTYENNSTKDTIFVSYKNITKNVNVGNRIFIDDGLISLICEKVEDNRLICRVENGGTLGTRKGINLPGVQVDLPPISKTDKLDIQFGVSEEVDMIMGSFTPNAAAVLEMKKLLGEKGRDIKIISKIENQQGLDNVDEIIDVSEGIMVERGDLGSEIPIQKVFLVQKSLIAKCNRLGVPVICATQMLESMVTKPRPTRAEVSDVANAVLDGAYCVMLSGETAKGDYPIECVDMMATICKEAESACSQGQPFVGVFCDTGRSDIPHSVAMAAVEASIKNRTSAIIVMTTTGESARLLAKFKPNCPIVAVTCTAQVARQLQLHRAVFPIVCSGSTEDEDWTSYVDSRVRLGMSYLKSKHVCKSGDKILVVTGWKAGPGHTNTMRVVDQEDFFLCAYSSLK